MRIEGIGPREHDAPVGGQASGQVFRPNPIARALREVYSRFSSARAGVQPTDAADSAARTSRRAERGGGSGAAPLGARLLFESLEPRILLSGDVAPIQGTLRIVADAGSDQDQVEIEVIVEIG